MNLEDVIFDDFMDLPSKQRKRILNDPDALAQLVKKNMKPSRFAHSLSVAQMAEKLARIHHVDPKKAYIAGILHDCTKDFDEEFHDSYLKIYDPDKLDYPGPAKHSFSAKYYLKEKLNFHDKDILNAVYNHTICFSRDRLSMILYICDKREPLRKIDDGIAELAEKDLHKAFRELSRSVEKYLREVKNERFIENGI